MKYANIVYFSDIFLNEQDLEKLQQLREGNIRGVNLEELRKEIWSIRSSGERRILLTKCEVDGKEAWLVLEILANHEYDRSPFLRIKGAKQKYLEARQIFLDQNGTATSKPVEQSPVQTYESTTPIPIRKICYYNKQILILRQDQKEALHYSLPLVLSGPGGSGKTCIGFIALERFIKQNPNLSGRIAYVTLEAKLAKVMSQNWQDSADVPNNSQITVDFLSYEDLAKQDPRWKTSFPPILVSYNEFAAWFNRQSFANDDDDNYSSLTLYQEFKIISVSSTLADYSSLFGANDSAFNTPLQKQFAFNLYQQYRDYCQKNNWTDLLFAPVTLVKPYDFMVSDESQNLSHRQLINCLLAVKDQQIVFPIDTNQNLTHGSSNRPYLLRLLREHSEKKTVNHAIFTVSKRNPPAVIAASNAILKLKMLLEKGRRDPNECAVVEMDVEATETGSITWLNAVTPNLIEACKRTDCIVLIPTQQDRARAFAQLGSPQIGCPLDFQGLEANVVIYFDPLSHPAFTEINKYIPDNLANQPLKLNQPKNKSDKSMQELVTAVQELYVGMTRGKRDVFIIAAPNRAISKVYQHLKSATESKNKRSSEVLQPESTIEEWEKRKEFLIQNDMSELAEQIEVVKLKPKRHVKRKTKTKPQVNTVTKIATSSSSSNTISTANFTGVSTSRKASSSTSPQIPLSPPFSFSMVADMLDKEKVKKLATFPNSLLNKFIIEPTASDLQVILNLNDLIYQSKNVQGLLAIDLFRVHLNYYLPSFHACTDSLKLFKVILDSKEVQKKFLLDREDFFRDDLFDLYVNSAVGLEILFRSVQVDKVLQADLLKPENIEFFWKRGKKLMLNMYGRLYVEQFIELDPESRLLTQISCQQLLTDNLFSYLLLFYTTAIKMASTLLKDLQYLVHITPDNLFHKFFADYTGFSLLCTAEECHPLLESILIHRHNLREFVTAELLFNKITYIHTVMSGTKISFMLEEKNVNVPHIIPADQHLGQIVPFTLLTTSTAGIHSLTTIAVHTPQVLRSLSEKIFVLDQTKISESDLIIRLALSDEGVELLHNLFRLNLHLYKDILIDVYFAQVPAQNRRKLKFLSGTPIIFSMLTTTLGAEIIFNLAELNLTFLKKLFENLLVSANLTDDPIRAIQLLDLLVTQEFGHKLIAKLLKTFPNEMHQLHWRGISTALNKSLITPFYFITTRSYESDVLQNWILNSPAILREITKDAFFDEIADPILQHHLSSVKPISAFVYCCSDQILQTYLLAILRAHPTYYSAVPLSQLFSYNIFKQPTGKPDPGPFVNLLSTKDGRTILCDIFKNNVDFYNVVKFSMLSIVHKNVVNDKTHIFMFAINWLMIDETGCELLFNILNKRRDFVEALLPRMIFRKELTVLGVESVCGFDLLIKNFYGRKILKFISQLRPDFNSGYEDLVIPDEITTEEPTPIESAFSYGSRR